jgi:hypothetical protein
MRVPFIPQENKVKNAMSRAALVSALFSVTAMVPAVSFAQSVQQGAVTRAQVRQELVDLEALGYNPSRVGDATYPHDVEVAMRRLTAKRALAAQEELAQSGYGNAPEQSVDAGAPASARAVGLGEPTAYPHR